MPLFGFILIFLVVAKWLNYALARKFRLVNFVHSFFKFYNMLYYFDEPRKIRVYMWVSNILNGLLIVVLAAVTVDQWIFPKK